MDLNVNYWDLNKEEKGLVKANVKAIRDYLLEESKNTDRMVRFDYDFGDPRTMNDGCVHTGTRHIYIRTNKDRDGVLNYEIYGCSGCLDLALCEEDYETKNHYHWSTGWNDEYALQLMKYWSEIKRAFNNYISGLKTSANSLRNFQV